MPQSRAPLRIVVVAPSPVSMFNLAIPEMLFGKVEVDGRPGYEVVICAAEPGPVPTSGGLDLLRTSWTRRRARGGHGARRRDRGALRAGVEDRDRRPGGGRRRQADRVPVHRRLPTRRGGSAARAQGHDVLGARRRAAPPLPARPAVRGRAVRPGRARTSPPPATPPVSTCACTSSAPTTAPPSPTRSPGVRSSRPYGPAARPSSPRPRCRPSAAPPAPTPGAGPCAPRQAAHPHRPVPPRRRQRPHPHPPLPRRERGEPVAVAAPPAHRARQGAAGDHRPAHGPGGPRQRPGDGRLAAGASGPAYGADAERLPGAVQPARKRSSEPAAGPGTGRAGVTSSVA